MRDHESSGTGGPWRSRTAGAPAGGIVGWPVARSGEAFPGRRPWVNGWRSAARKRVEMSGIDLRSDTVTLPTAEMFRAMTSAPLGDDVFGDDPTVNRLEETAAGRMGKQAALFVASGTMGNLLGLLVSARPGQEVIADADSHVFLNEAAGAAMVGGIQIRQVRTERGVLTPAQVLAALRPADDDHQPLSAAVMIENTHNWHGGVAWSLQDLQRLSGTARSSGLAVHLDGARIFNAA